MKTVILAGGFGTRIRDVSEDIPKPMIPIGSYPIIWHIMKLYSYYNFKKFILCLGYKSHIIKDYFLNFNNINSDFTINLKENTVKRICSHLVEDWEITFAETGLNSFTGARVYKVKKYVENEEYFMLTYGDGVSNVDLEKLIKFHKSHGKILTITGAYPPARFGELELDGNQVVAFNEKPQVTSGYISAGFFVCSRKILDYLSSNEDLVFEKDPINNLVKDGEVMVYKHKGFWHPMDTSREYKFLNEIWSSKTAPWKVWK